MVMGKEVRLSRLFKNGRMLCVPMDHGVTSGPIKGLTDINDIVNKVDEGGASAVILHKGMIKGLKRPPSLGIIMHATASTVLGPSPNYKVQIAVVEEAIRLGADGVSVHINIGAKEEPEMLATLGYLSDSSDEWGMPFLAMMYPRGEFIKNPNDPAVLAHVVRVGAELGADVVKTSYTGDPDSFKQVVKACPVPVVIAGGPKVSTDRELLEMAKGAIEAGAKGVTFGRNVFQHDNPVLILKALGKIVYENWSVEEALEVLKGEKQSSYTQTR